MYTSGSKEAALGASRLLNTPILGAAGAGQVISIIRGEGSHTYVNAVVVKGGEGWRYGWGFRGAAVGSWGGLGRGLTAHQLGHVVSTAPQRVDYSPFLAPLFVPPVPKHG